MTRKNTVSKTRLNPLADELARLLFNLPLKSDSIEFLDPEQQHLESSRYVAPIHESLTNSEFDTWFFRHDY